MKYLSKGPADTKKIAKKIFQKHPDIRVFLLYGELASGKTTFAKGIAECLGLNGRLVKSPTFTFISEHPGLCHCDLYRLEALDATIAESLKEHLESDTRLVIEWPDLLESQISTPHLKIKFTHLGKNKRQIESED
ncbi:tRNA (adenosine(37)-N6)-threonylcarbamoyltransferase complex ATPase subunit type 1 TsaE [Candidatus Peregrinibacteria bacterium]|nr:tRNA (adenosine(37)-N6)-threonylcarbamoyltransferase complex ATPase subunit type 1 TsaE [Candidatus Peregrinibacteria bacterium]